MKAQAISRPSASGNKRKRLLLQVLAFAAVGSWPFWFPSSQKPGESPTPAKRLSNSVPRDNAATARRATDGKLTDAVRSDDREVRRSSRPVRQRLSDAADEPDTDEGIEVDPGHHLESDLAGGHYQVPDGFHLEHEVRTYTVEDGHHLEFDSEGRGQIIEDGYTLGPDGFTYVAVENHHMVADSEGRVWAVHQGYDLGPDDEVYEVAEDYHLEAGPDRTVWQVPDGYTIGPDGELVEAPEALPPTADQAVTPP